MSINLNVAILMSTFNGAKFLSEQLDSLANQNHENWILYVRDDGSADKTLEILNEYERKWGSKKIIIFAGSNIGFSKSFLTLACDKSIKADYYAFCDQDDIWLPEKLTKAINLIQITKGNENAFLYCGRSHYVSEKLQPCGQSPLFIFPPNFRNALVQSIAGGNTMVFNQKTKNMLENIGLVDVPSHDWWLYILISGIDGVVFYDQNPYLLYRQHSQALVGGNVGLSRKLKRIFFLFQGRFRQWNSMNIEALNTSSCLLSTSNLKLLELFTKLRKSKLKDRLRLLQICGLYRQTRDGTISLYIAAIFGKI
jgi:glycosyltransferase involved in cell wall biosynthesis